MAGKYDAIVLGARCAGSPLAMLLARQGYRVLVVDRATFPSDTISTHMIHPPGVAALKRWGLLDRVVATGCPPIDTYAFDFGPFTLTGDPGTKESPVAFAPRRTVLDKILLDGAAEAGAEVREAFTVEEIQLEAGAVTGIRGHGKDGASVTEHARVIIGADGRNSLVASTVNAETYHEKPQLLAAYYSYWSGLPVPGRFEVYIRPHRGFAAWPTNDGLTLVVGGWPFAEFEENWKDPEGHFMRMLELVPSFAERIQGARREERFAGAMSDFQAVRDRHALPRYEFTTQLATLELPPPEMGQTLAAAHGNQEAMDGFARVNSGVLSPPEFFSPENVGRIFAAAANRSSG